MPRQGSVAIVGAWPSECNSTTCCIAARDDVNVRRLVAAAAMTTIGANHGFHGATAHGDAYGTAFPADPRSDQRARPRAAGDRHADHRPSRAGVRRAWPACAGSLQDRLPHQEPGDHLSLVRHRRVGGGDRQCAVARRQGADGRDRPLCQSVARAGRAFQDRGRHDSGRLAPRRVAGADRGEARRRQGAPHQGGDGRAQRDVHRRHQPRRRHPQSHRPGKASGAVHGRHHLVARLGRL